MILITLSLIVLAVWGYRLHQTSTMVRLGFVLILGGAVGNWVDRFRFGAVIDFIDFRFWPVFNIADSAITAGVFCFLILFLKRPKEHKES